MNKGISAKCKECGHCGLNVTLEGSNVEVSCLRSVDPCWDGSIQMSREEFQNWWDRNRPAANQNRPLADLAKSLTHNYVTILISPAIKYDELNIDMERETCCERLGYKHIGGKVVRCANCALYDTDAQARQAHNIECECDLVFGCDFCDYRGWIHVDDYFKKCYVTTCSQCDSLEMEKLEQHHAEDCNCPMPIGPVPTPIITSKVTDEISRLLKRKKEHGLTAYEVKSLYKLRQALFTAVFNYFHFEVKMLEQPKTIGTADTLFCAVNHPRMPVPLVFYNGIKILAFNLRLTHDQRLEDVVFELEMRDSEDDNSLYIKLYGRNQEVLLVWKHEGYSIA